nr:MAG TPA: hypothetical protein [Caudoviricetes sp.]
MYKIYLIQARKNVFSQKSVIISCIKEEGQVLL